MAVVLGLLALVVGPLLGPLLQRSRAALSLVDSFVIITVGGLVLTHILPQSVTLSGPLALAAAMIGLFAPAMLHRLDARLQTSSSSASRLRATLVVVVMAAGAFLHATLDGVALVDGHDHGPGHGNGHDDESVSLLAIAVLLHRVPYGLALWMVGREPGGRARSLVLLSALALGTLVGAGLGEALIAQAASAFALMQAFAAGAVLHVLLEAPPAGLAQAPRASFAGAVLGGAVLLGVALTHPVAASVDDELHFGATLSTLSLEVSPAVLLGIGIVGLLGATRGRTPLVGARAGGLRQALSGIFAGLPLPLCSCSVVPIFEGLVRRRASVAAAVAFLVSAPELGAIPALASVELLGWRLTLVRLFGAGLVAIIAGLFVAPMATTTSSAPHAEAEGTPTTFAQAVRSALDHVAPWVVVGVLVAASAEPLVSAATLGELPRALEVPLYALLGVPLYVCATGSTPLAAIFLHKGASAGAILAFLWSGPATNVATLGLIARLLSVRAAVVFAVSVFSAATLLGVGLNLLDVSLAIPDLHADAVHAHGFVEWAAALSLGGLLLWSLWRQGLRGFLHQVVDPFDDAKGGHVHGPHCGHQEHARAGFLRRPPVARVTVDFVVAGEPRAGDGA